MFFLKPGSLTNHTSVLADPRVTFEHKVGTILFLNRMFSEDQHESTDFDAFLRSPTKDIDLFKTIIKYCSKQKIESLISECIEQVSCDESSTATYACQLLGYLLSIYETEHFTRGINVLIQSIENNEHDVESICLALINVFPRCDDETIEEISKKIVHIFLSGENYYMGMHSSLVTVIIELWRKGASTNPIVIGLANGLLKSTFDIRMASGEALITIFTKRYSGIDLSCALTELKRSLESDDSAIQEAGMYTLCGISKTLHQSDDAEKVLDLVYPYCFMSEVDASVIEYACKAIHSLSANCLAETVSDKITALIEQLHTGKNRGAVCDVIPAFAPGCTEEMATLVINELKKHVGGSDYPTIERAMFNFIMHGPSGVRTTMVETVFADSLIKCEKEASINEYQHKKMLNYFKSIGSSATPGKVSILIDLFFERIARGDMRFIDDYLSIIKNISETMTEAQLNCFAEWGISQLKAESNDRVKIGFRLLTAIGAFRLQGCMTGILTILIGMLEKVDFPVSRKDVFNLFLNLISEKKRLRKEDLSIISALFEIKLGQQGARWTLEEVRLIAAIIPRCDDLGSHPWIANTLISIANSIMLPRAASNFDNESWRCFTSTFKDYALAHRHVKIPIDLGVFINSEFVRQYKTHVFVMPILTALVPHCSPDETALLFSKYDFQKSLNDSFDRTLLSSLYCVMIPKLNDNDLIKMAENKSPTIHGVALKKMAEFYRQHKLKVEEGCSSSNNTLDKNAQKRI